jgi:hypothetical protein
VRRFYKHPAPDGAISRNKEGKCGFFELPKDGGRQIMVDAPGTAEGRELFDKEDLALTIDLILEGDEHAPLLLAQLFVSFRQAIDSGLHGINQTRQALANSIELIYLHSPAHQAALNLYRLSVEGELRVEDEPLKVINAALQRTMSRIRRSKSSTRARQRR